MMPSERNTTKKNCRRLLLMVKELHAMGYEQLRIVPGVAPSGMYWRLAICPASDTLPEHGARMRVQMHDTAARYSTGSGSEYYGWTDAADDTPRQLAEKFVARFPILAKQGKRDDPAYVQWFEEMLQSTEPDGLVYAYAAWDWDCPDDRLGILSKSQDIMVPLPPPAPGLAEKAELQDLALSLTDGDEFGRRITDELLDGLALERDRLGDQQFLVLLKRRRVDIDGLHRSAYLLESFDTEESARMYADAAAEALKKTPASEPDYDGRLSWKLASESPSAYEAPATPDQPSHPIRVVYERSYDLRGAGSFFFDSLTDSIAVIGSFTGPIVSQDLFDFIPDNYNFCGHFESLSKNSYFYEEAMALRKVLPHRDLIKGLRTE